MTKQDIYDIIQLLEAHFDSIGQEVRNEIRFKFVQGGQDRFVEYDNKSLFTQSLENEDGYYEGEEEVDSIKSDLAINYNSIYTYYPEVEKQLEEEVKKTNFNLMVFKYLSPEFKVLSFDEEDEESYFIIQDSESTGESKPTKHIFRTEYDDDSDYEEIDEVDEKVQLKKFNQFK